MMRRLALALIVLGACDSVGASLFSLGTFEREFPGSLSPVEIPGFEARELLDASNVEALVEILGYDVPALVSAGANFADLQSVVEATRAIGMPIEDRDESIRALLSSIASLYVNETLNNPDKGIFVRIDLSTMFDDPLDYDRLERSIRERAHGVPVGIEVTRRMETIDEVFLSNLELVALVRSGWLASLQVTEIGLRTLMLAEELRVRSGMGLQGSLYDPERMEGCMEDRQVRIQGLEQLAIALRSLADDAEWVEILDAEIESDHPICAWRTELRSPELVDVLAEDQGLEIRIRVRTLLPREPFLLGGYLWFDSESININLSEF
jgi:hypothetical protein